jgi:nitrate reductase gamma subunit
MYQFLTGPLLWLSFLIFFIGLIVRVVWYVRGLSWQMDRVAYTKHVFHGIKGALRSIFFWLLPFGTRRWKTRPAMTILFFVFHIGIVITPIFLLAHNIILKERWGISWATLPGPVADALTIGVFVSALFLVLRRIAFSEVRILTSAYDYLLLAITVAPFFTGFLANLKVAGYPFWLYAHIISGEIMLIAIPLTKLSHIVLFFLSRGQLGMDYGIKRGGMKGRGLAW